MKSIIYGGWFRDAKIVTQIESEEEARSHHEKRELYFATLYEDDDPYCFLEINNDFFSVSFLDEHNREYLSYEFNEYEPGKLFLVEAQHWEYDGDTDTKLHTELYRFNQTGKVRLRKVDLKTNEMNLSESDGVDVSKNYEDYPEFGEYEKVIVKER